MTTKIKKWGNSLALRIPHSYAKVANIEEGNEVNLKLYKNKIIIEKEPKKSYSLKNLLSVINKKNLHKEIKTGKRVGKEIW